MEAFHGLIVVGSLFALLLVILWIILPFAMFGIKPLLRELIQEQRTTNALLKGRLESRQAERK